MSTTLDFFNASKVTLSGQIGRLPVERILDATDAIMGIRVTCYRVVREAGLEVSERDAATIENVSHKLSLARLAKVLTLWRKWTHQHHDTAPSPSSVTSFLWDCRTTLKL